MWTNDSEMIDIHTKFSKPKAKSKNCTIIRIGHMDDSRPALHCGNSIDSHLRRNRELRTFPPCSKNKKLTHMEIEWMFLRTKLVIRQLFLLSGW